MTIPNLNLSRWQSFRGRKIAASTGAEFILDSFHAAGGHGALFKAHLIGDLHSIVAVKYRRNETSVPAASSFAFESHLLTTTLPRHKNIIASYGITTCDCGELGRGLIIEWAPLSLQQLIGKLSWELFLPIFAGVLEGLHHIHVQEIVHRDISPENILFTPFEPSTPKLADFGVAITLDAPLNADSRAFGKPGFCHPHAADIEPCVELDLYSAAACAYCLLTGGVAPDITPAHADLVSRLRTGYKAKHSNDLPLEFANLIADLLSSRVTSASGALDRLCKCRGENDIAGSRDPITTIEDQPQFISTDSEHRVSVGTAALLAGLLPSPTVPPMLAPALSTTRIARRGRVFMAVALSVAICAVVWISKHVTRLLGGSAHAGALLAGATGNDVARPDSDFEFAEDVPEIAGYPAGNGFRIVDDADAIDCDPIRPAGPRPKPVRDKARPDSGETTALKPQRDTAQHPTTAEDVQTQLGRHIASRPWRLLRRPRGNASQ